MPAEWYYTTNKQQMGPVSWAELRELANNGILKPHDMVWADGMDEWVKAINQSGLFAESDADEEEEEAPTKKSSYKQPKPPPGRRRRVEEEEEEDELDAKEEKRRARKKSQQRTQMAVGLKIGLILGGVLLVLLLLSCAGGLIVWLAFGLGGGGGGRQTYTISNLPQGGINDRRFDFQQNRRVVITVTNTLSNPNTDVDLYVLRGNENIPIVSDINIPQNDRNCRVDFVVPSTGSYVVRIVNLGPGNANSCSVVVDPR